MEGYEEGVLLYLEQISDKLDYLSQASLEIAGYLGWLNNVWVPSIVVVTLFWVVYSQFLRMRD